jgi:hypothetical protein
MDGVGPQTVSRLDIGKAQQYILIFDHIFTGNGGNVFLADTIGPEKEMVLVFFHRYLVLF